MSSRSCFLFSPCPFRAPHPMHFPLTSRNLVSMLLPEKNLSHREHHARAPWQAGLLTGRSDPSGKRFARYPDMSDYLMARILLSLSLSLLYILFKANRTCFNQSEYASVRVSAPELFYVCERHSFRTMPSAFAATPFIIHHSSLITHHSSLFIGGTPWPAIRNPS